MPTLMGVRNGEGAAFSAAALLVTGNAYNRARGGNRANGGGRNL